MLEASARGLQDFSRARVLEPEWWSRLYLHLRVLAEDREKQLLESDRRETFWRLLFATSNERQEALHNMHQHLRQSLQKLLKPWLPVETGPDQNTLNRLEDSWRRNWGNPADPAVAAKIKATADAIMQRAARNKRQLPQGRAHGPV